MTTKEKENIVLRTVSIYDAMNAYSPRKISSKGMCCCPIHNESHPSCKVYPNNSFHCFACGANGDVIGLVKSLYSLNYREALDKIAKDFGISEIISEEERRAIEKKQKAEQEKRNYELRQKAIVRTYTDKLSDALILSRKKCSYWYKKPILSTEEMDEYAKEKQKIKQLEKIYIELNRLDLMGEPRKTNEVITEYKEFLETL